MYTALTSQEQEPQTVELRKIRPTEQKK